MYPTIWQWLTQLRMEVIHAGLCPNSLGSKHAISCRQYRFLHIADKIADIHKTFQQLVLQDPIGLPTDYDKNFLLRLIRGMRSFINSYIPHALSRRTELVFCRQSLVLHLTLVPVDPYRLSAILSAIPVHNGRVI